VLEQVSLLTDDLRLEARHFMRVLPRGEGLPAAAAAQPHEASTPAQDPSSPAVRPLADAVADLERRAIADALRATGGNKLAAARLLRISRATLYEKLAIWPELRQLS
jgi:DNA-binding NtrC family response regulator